MGDIMKIELKSRRTGESYQAGIYKKEMPDGREDYVILHKSLKRIFMDLGDKKPDTRTEAFDVSKWPGTPPMFAMKCTMGKIEAIGELTGVEWEASFQSQNLIKAYNPIALCSNRAFDKAFIQYMQFIVCAGNECLEGGVYSSSEMSDMGGLIPLNGDVDVMLDGRGMSQSVVGQQAVGQAAWADVQQPPAQGMALAMPAYQTAPAPVQGMDTGWQPPHGASPVPQAAGGNGTQDNAWNQAPASYGAGYPLAAPAPEPAAQAAQRQAVRQPQPVQQRPHGPAAPGNGRPSGADPRQAATHQGSRASAPAGQNKRPAVMGVEFDCSQKMTRITTDVGIVFFNPKTGEWKGGTFTAKDLAYIKAEAEHRISQSLETFCGIGM